MANGRAMLQEWIARLEHLPQELVAATVPEAARALHTDITAHVAAAESPDGAAWQPKQDGGAPLVGADQDVSVDVVGTVVLVKLKGKFVRHHKGTARGGIRRQVIPTRNVPDAVARAIGKAMTKHFQRLASGGG